MWSEIPAKDEMSVFMADIADMRSAATSKVSGFQFKPSDRRKNPKKTAMCCAVRPARAMFGLRERCSGLQESAKEMDGLQEHVTHRCLVENAYCEKQCATPKI